VDVIKFYLDMQADLLAKIVHDVGKKDQFMKLIERYLIIFLFFGAKDL
jgi:hypothetical protein